jgi:carbon-monoxide dehydrogenase small subunit
MMQREVTLRVNGELVTEMVESRLLLLDFLRDTVGLRGTHAGCEQGACGACTVLVDGVPLRSCLLFAVQSAGMEITTIEAYGPAPLHPVQEAFREHHGLQCGFCTPGMVLTSIAFLREVPDPEPAQIRDALSGNICRCTGYVGIVNAVHAAAAELRA